MKIKVITIAVALALGTGQAAKADLLDQLKGGCALGCPPTGGGGGGGGEAIIPLSEVEPNDTPQTATPLTPGQPQSGGFQTSGDQDWYRFRVTQSGAAATLEIAPNRRGYRLSLQTSSGQVLARFQNDDKETRKFTVVLPQLGDFFLVAESLGASGYTFTLSGEGISPPITGPGGLPEGALTEIEPNDIQQTATALKPDAFHGGQVSAADSDFFRFQVTAAGSIEVFLPGSNGEFTLTILDAAGRVLASQKSAGFDQTFLVVVSTPGDYFVRLSSPVATPVSYLFKLKGDTMVLPLDRRNEFLRQAQREVEPNDSLVASNPIIPGRPVAGQLRSKDDEDWFALRTTRDNTVINVEMPKGPAKWKISIFDAAGNLLDQRESLTDSDLVFAATIEHTGKFYLSIAGVDDTRADYAFNVTGEGLQNPSDRNPNANFHNVEIEPNDALKDANPLTSAVRLLGQLRNGSDVDLFKLESLGNEILSVELCPKKSSSTGTGGGGTDAEVCKDPQSWVIYVFNKNVTQQVLDKAKITLQKCENDTQVSNSVTFLKRAYQLGHLDQVLLGVIDLKLSESQKIELGLRDPGTYYLAVALNDEREIELKNITCGKDANGQGIPFTSVTVNNDIRLLPNTQRYELQVVQTGLTPALSPRLAQSQELASVVHVPLVEVNGVEYWAELRLFSQGGVPLLELVRLEPIGTAVAVQDIESLKREAMRTTVVGDRVHIPLAVYNGHYYAGELRMFEDNGRLLFQVLSATPLD